MGVGVSLKNCTSGWLEKLCMFRGCRVSKECFEVAGSFVDVSLLEWYVPNLNYIEYFDLCSFREVYVSDHRKCIRFRHIYASLFIGSLFRPVFFVKFIFVSFGGIKVFFNFQH